MNKKRKNEIQKQKRKFFSRKARKQVPSPLSKVFSAINIISPPVALPLKSDELTITVRPVLPLPLAEKPSWFDNCMSFTDSSF